MSIGTQWYRGLNDELAAHVRAMLNIENEPTSEQIEEVPELAESFGVDMLELDPPERERLEAAIEELEEQLHAADPRPRFLKLHDGVELSPALRSFFEEGKHERYQHAKLEGTEYAPYPLYVDFEAIGSLINPDHTGETLGDDVLVFANLLESPNGEPRECYAHLVIAPDTTAVSLVEPSGDPETLAANLDAFLGRLVS